MAAAQQLTSSALLDTVRAAFVSGMDRMFWVSGAVMTISVVLALLFLPARGGEPARLREESRAG